MAVRLTFYGAAQTVTGSRYLLESESGSILIDCGLFQGEKELRLRNWEKPAIDFKELSSIVLTHAHLDHIGYLPAAVKYGFSGPIYSTKATRELSQILLLDSAHLQEEEARFANEHRTSKHLPALPLYTRADAQRAIELFRPLEQGAKVAPGIRVQTAGVGHILGAVSLQVEVEGRRITCSGDVGRYDAPILPDPQPVDLGDLLLCESTYGDRAHPDADVEEELAQVVHRAIDRKGLLLVPAFAVGRTQTLLYYLAKLERAGRVPELPIYVDSPMALDATEIYRRYHFDFDEEAKTELGGVPLRTARTRFCRSAEESKSLNHLRGPRIVISASGMATGGRILHHLTHWLSDETTTILFVGFQAKGTRGAIIESGAETVKVFGMPVPVRAHVEKLSALSAHADRGELLRWLRSCTGRPKQAMIVHGEPEVSEKFARTLQEKFNWKAAPAEYGQTVEV